MGFNRAPKVTPRYRDGTEYLPHVLLGMKTGCQRWPLGGLPGILKAKAIPLEALGLPLHVRIQQPGPENCPAARSGAAGSGGIQAAPHDGDCVEPAAGGFGICLL